MPPTPNAPPEEDDDFEYEVEPADEEVTAHQVRRAREDLARAERAIDVDAIYRELENRGDFDAAFEKFRARFSVRSVLIATTVVAIILGVGGLGIFNGTTFAGFICLSLIGLGSAHAWLNYQEGRRRAELIARREAELRRARGDADDDFEPEPAQPPPSPAELLASFFRFTLMDLMIATAAAAVMLTLMSFAGSAGKAAAAMGALAITGFALQAAEINIPRPLLLAWWLALLGYCVLTVVSIVI
ncbi:hypothetical protein Pla108_00270 [Botrimarina colliarenosi]|uniref:Uncharacterized protein n=1 Tax=Botrimarina colliarenosi TaxID=2528001 RepID=A0A5C6AGJ8_9BACT|nr:hypothetical protein [Botrimarina colliarenosi]TWT99094.1 hypothetical protein Pla108_00270 [Botrimarina colliarenosi]